MRYIIYKRWIPAFAGMTMVMLISYVSHAVAPTVIVPPGPFKPGQTLIVEYTVDERKAPQLIWGEEQVSFFKNPQRKWRALIRIAPDLEPGPTELIVQANKKLKIPFTIEISPSDFGFETIVFPEDKKRLLNDPSEGEESRLIRKFLAEFQNDSEQLWDGPFEKPIPGTVISRYGVKRKKVGQDNLSFHRGIDLRGGSGTPIRAPNGAKVIMTRDFKFHGRTVLLSHGQGIGSVYIHMKKIDVQEGQMVKKGENIGEVGMSGLATAPHLHWGLYVHRKAVNPIQWLEQSF